MEIALSSSEVNLTVVHSLYFEPDEGVVFVVSLGDEEVGNGFLLADHMRDTLQVLKETGDYRSAYTIGHELAMHADDLLQLAEKMDRGLVDSVLYDIDPEDLQ